MERPLDELARIDIEESDGVVVARVVGEIDISNVAEARRVLTEGVSNSALGLVVDVSGTTHLDSSGVHLLFGLSTALQDRKQQLCIVAPETAPGSRVLYVTGFDRIVPMTATLEDAIARVRAPAPPAPAA